MTAECEIELSQNQKAVVDEKNYDWLMAGLKWGADWKRNTRSFYASFDTGYQCQESHIRSCQ